MLPYNGLRLVINISVSLFILLFSGQKADCQQNILDSLYTFREGSVKTGNALEIIRKKTGYNFTYDSRLIDPDVKVEMNFTNEKLDVILDKILQNDSLNYSIIDRYIIISRLIPSSELLQESDIIPGKNFVSGLVVDDETGDPLPFAAISLKNTGRGTITNNIGEFYLNTPPSYHNDTLVVSYLGYTARNLPVNKALNNYLTVAMKKEFISIPEIIIRFQMPQDIIYKAVSSIPRNYGNTPALLTGFYREGVMKKDFLQSYSEAILQIFKSSYSGSLLGDQIKIYKSRKIENLTSSDTLAVRLKAGLSTTLDLDGVKNMFDFIDIGTMDEYKFRMTDIVPFEDDAAFVIDFEQKEEIEIPRYFGTMYINTSDFAILQVDYVLHPRYIDDLKNSFIINSSREFRTWPVDVRYSVSYRKYNDRYFLNHVRGDLVFTARRKNKLFNTQYNVFFELAVTGTTTINVTRFEREELAPVHSIFTQTVTSYDSEFWENQDFLKPEENLLQALKNMNVRLQEFSDDNP